MEISPATQIAPNPFSMVERICRVRALTVRIFASAGTAGRAMIRSPPPD